MVSFWWLIVALMVGTCFGILAMALMRMSGGLPESSAIETDADELRMVDKAFLL